MIFPSYEKTPQCFMGNGWKDTLVTKLKYDFQLKPAIFIFTNAFYFLFSFDAERELGSPRRLGSRSLLAMLFFRWMSAFVAHASCSW